MKNHRSLDPLTKGIVHLESFMIERNAVLKKAYNLLCLFFANKEIARRSNPVDSDAPLTSLERMFFSYEVSHLLIEIAIAVRILDDQMKKLPSADSVRCQYERLKTEVDGYSYGLFDDLDLNLRETCNKIIHSDVMEPHSKEGYEAHESDIAHLHGDGDRTVNWSHLNGYVRLCGIYKRKEWYMLLNIEVFVTAIFRLFNGSR